MAVADMRLLVRVSMQIGELLVAAGLVTQVQIAQAVDRQHEAGGRLGPNLVAMGRFRPRRWRSSWMVCRWSPLRWRKRACPRRF